VFLDAFNIEVNTVNKAIPAGFYYLRHSFLGLSLIDTLEAAVLTEAPNAEWYVNEGRKAYLEPRAGEPVAIDWLSSIVARNLVGYDANMPSQETPYEAANVSPLLFSPGFVGTPETLLGTPGFVVNDMSRQASADGSVVQVTTFSEQVQQRVSWTHILAERMRVDAGLVGGGTWHEWHEQSAKLGFSLRYYQEQAEVDGSVVKVTWDDTASNSHGPYSLASDRPRAYGRVVRTADLYSPLDIRLLQVAEYP
jgi:hypothetical protein